MVFFLNSDGSCQRIAPERVYQGSNNVNGITVVAPFAATTAMQIGFVLPNGLYWQSRDGERYLPMDPVAQSVEPCVNAWRFTLPISLTEQTGELLVAFNALSTDGNATSYACKVFIEESVLPNFSKDDFEPSAYDLLQLYIAKRTNYLVKSVQKVADNAFTYTTYNGVESAPIVLADGKDAPIPVNVGSTVFIPSSAWVTVSNGYRYDILPGVHGQMVDGATSGDLWVSCSYGEKAKAQTGEYPEYVVSEDGTVTITSTEKSDMIVRVWNGKGLVGKYGAPALECKFPFDSNGKPNIGFEYDQVLNYEGLSVFNRTPVVGDFYVMVTRDTNGTGYWNCNMEVVNVDVPNNRARVRFTWISSLFGQKGERGERGISGMTWYAPTAEYTGATTLFVNKATVIPGSQISEMKEYDFLICAATDSQDEEAKEHLYFTQINTISGNEIECSILYAMDGADGAQGADGKDGNTVTLRLPASTLDIKLVNSTGTVVESARQYNETSGEAFYTLAPFQPYAELFTASVYEAGVYYRLSNGLGQYYLCTQITWGTAAHGSSVNQDYYVNATFDALSPPNGFKAVSPYNFGTCVTSPTVEAKIVTLSNTQFTLEMGAKITVVFTLNNTVSSPTLNVNNTGAKRIICNGIATDLQWKSGEVMELIYNGNYWQIVGGYSLADKPVDSLWFTLGSDSPAYIFGGTWTRLPENYALWTAASGAGNTISAGLPNITGSFQIPQGWHSETWHDYSMLNDKSGAFGTVTGTRTGDSWQVNGATQSFEKTAFDASASNSIYGKSTTVQPPAYKVYAWRRTA